MFKRILTYTVLIVLAIITLVPFAYLFSASLKTSEDFFSSLFLPAGDGFLGIAWDRLTLGHYRRLFTQMDFTRHIVNSFFYSSVISTLATLSAAMGGYALARFRFRFRGLIMNVVLASLIIPGALLLAPSYQMLFRLGLLDTIFGFILPAIAPPFGVYLFRQATLTGVPTELLEAARIDGCGEFRIFFTVVLPLVRPMVGAFLLINFLGAWNNFIGPQIVLQTPERFPLSVAVAQLKGSYSQDYGMLMAGTVISIIPVLILFLMLQREFIAGLTAGAVKG
jgi:ABC-type glycerol-3-phosphate transport system permease component